MGSSAEEKCALIQGPIAAADATGQRGVYRVAISGVAQNATLPSFMTAGRGFVSLFATADIQWAFGIGSAPTIALNEASAVGTGDVNAGQTLSAATREQWPVPPGATHIGWIGTSGFLEIVNSQGQAV